MHITSNGIKVRLYNSQAHTLNFWSVAEKTPEEKQTCHQNRDKERRKEYESKEMQTHSYEC